MNELREVKEIFDRIASVSAKSSKEAILKQNKDNELFKQCLKFLLDPNIVTGLSIKKLNKKLKYGFIVSPNISILKMFKYLEDHNTGTDDDIKTIQMFCKHQTEDEEFWLQFFAKKIKLGCDAKTVNKVIKGLIPEFNIMLGSKFDFDKIPKETMYITEKYDGLRCFTIIRNGKITMKSRQNKIFEGLVDIESSIKTLGLNDVCLDGELLSINSSYENVYKDTTKKVNNKNEVKHGVKYMLFDIIPLNEFDNSKGKMLYSERRNILDNLKIENEFIEVAPTLYKGDNMDVIIKILDKYRGMGAEGLMCSLDKPYEFKRSKSLLKMKVMQSCDLKIIGFEEGQGRLKNTLGKLICDYKGFELGVGSGFSDELRNEIWNNQNKYLGCVAEIQYFEETHNDKNELSLRFPVFKCMREEGKDVSYE